MRLKNRRFITSAISTGRTIINDRTDDPCSRYLWAVPNFMRKDDKSFDPARYGMIFCPECKGSGKSLGIGKETNVCTVCGGFGLIKKEEKDCPPRK